ncbi:MAG: hypothetical protein ACXABY_02575 [Candidatus Thorarchaeota archaeon]|jgi:hypothetical protein
MGIPSSKITGDEFWLEVSLGGVVFLVETQPLQTLSDDIQNRMYKEFPKLKEIEGPLPNGLYVLTFEADFPSDAFQASQITEWLYDQLP